MIGLTKDQENKIAFRTRKLHEIDFNGCLQQAKYFSQKAQKHEVLSDEEQVVFVKAYALIRDIALLEAYSKHLTPFQITEEVMQQCCSIVSVFEKKSASASVRMGLFEKHLDQMTTQEDVERLFARLSSKTGREQEKRPAPKM